MLLFFFFAIGFFLPRVGGLFFKCRILRMHRVLVDEIGCVRPNVKRIRGIAISRGDENDTGMAGMGETEKRAREEIIIICKIAQVVCNNFGCNNFDCSSKFVDPAELPSYERL